MAYYTKKEITANIEATKSKPLHQQRDEFQAKFNAAKRPSFFDDVLRFVVATPLCFALVYCVIKAIKWVFWLVEAI